MFLTIHHSGTLDQLLDDFNLSFSQGGLLTTIFIVSYMILSPVFGFLGKSMLKALILIQVKYLNVTPRHFLLRSRFF